MGRLVLIVIVAVSLPTDAGAHAFGARYDLPLPLWLYLAAAGAAVLLSFMVMALVATPGRVASSPDGVAATGVWCDGPRLGLWLAAGRTVSVSLLICVVLAAFTGDDSPTGNFAAVFVWVVWWVGLMFFQALVADVWTQLNPWHALARVLRRIRGGGRDTWDDAALLSYPRWLNHWPALFGFLLFAWMELVSDLGEQPRVLGALIVAYSVATLLGALLFGARAWFFQADPFTSIFRLVGRFAPLAFVGGQFKLRWPGSGLLAREPVPVSMVLLVLALLATVSFDGFVETSAWASTLGWVTQNESLRAPLLELQRSGVDLLKLVKTVGLLLAVAVFASVYGVFAVLIDRCSGDARGLAASAGWYVLTLVPIAIGYHVAHYLSYLLIAGQLIIPLASDPFAMGWDLFGTAAYDIDIAIVDARFVWFTAVLTIVIGHVIAVVLAHVTALRILGDRGRAIRSQVPMLVLMVAYTMTSLWILSQPIVVD